MTLLDRLRPRWRHSDPQVRATTVRELGRDAQEVLAAVAEQDEDVHVRRVAVKQLGDSDVLLRIAETDPDEGLRSLAAARADELFRDLAASRREVQECEQALARITRAENHVAVATTAFHASVRRSALSRVSDVRALEEIAERSPDPSIGLEAMARISDVAVLKRIALGRAPTEVALAVIERIGDPDVLHAIGQDRRAQKMVRRRARTKLDDVIDDEHPIRIAERRERQVELCVVVEDLGIAPTATGAAERLRAAQAEWGDLAACVPSPADLEVRFQHACAAVHAEIADREKRRADEERREAERQEDRSFRQRLCETVDSIGGPDAPRGLEDARAQWRRLGPPDDDQSLTLAQRFAQAVERCEGRYERWQVRDAFRSRLEALVQEAEKLAQSKRLQGGVERARADLDKRWSKLAASSPGKKWIAAERELHERFVRAGEVLEERRQAAGQQDERQRQQTLEQLRRLCVRLEELAKADTIRPAAAEGALHAGADALQQLGPLPATERPDEWKSRLSRAHEELSRRSQEQASAEEWRRWANVDVQKRLIERAEALLETEDLGEVLRELGQLDQEWKRFATAPRDQSQTLWNRFRSARQELRRRGDAYLADNQKRKEALCETVEGLADSTDWKATAEAIQRAQAEWEQIGPVHPKVSQALWARFRAPCNGFFHRRNDHLRALKLKRKEATGQRTALCETAEGLADSTEWETTAAEIKRLQVEWKRIPPSPGKQSEVLWIRFRTACDRYFERYRRRDELAFEEKLLEAESVLTDLEALRASLAGSDAPEPEGIATGVNEAVAAWARAGPIPAEKATELNERFRSACEAIDAACPAALDGSELDSESRWKQRQKLCHRLEQLVESHAENLAEPSPVDLAEQLKQAMAANAIGGSAALPEEQATQATIEEAERLKARWERLGPVVGERSRALSTRFQKAYADFRASRPT